MPKGSVSRVAADLSVAASSGTHVVAFIGSAQPTLVNERIQDDSAGCRAKPEEAGSLRDTQAQPWHLAVRPDDHRYEVFARRFSGNGVSGA
jgi:hypothetical protein